MQEVSEEKTGGLIMNEKVRDIHALAGERWLPLETSIVDDMQNLSGDWPVCSEFDTL